MTTLALPNPLVLVGMRGVGKSTVGRCLATLLNWAFVDCDVEIERAAGRTARDIFATDGEAEFRRIEARVLNEILARRDVVVATGGGCVTIPDVRAELARRTAVWLTAPAAVLAQRVKHSDRPSLTGAAVADEVAAVLAVRTPLYAAVAAAEFRTDLTKPEQVAAAILAHFGIGPQAH